MPFGIHAIRPADEEFVEITEEDFAQLRSAKQNLVILQSVEDKLAILLANYAEWETTLLVETVNNVVFQESGWSDAVELVYTLNRRLVNLLTACRLYIDHVKHDLNSMYGAESEIGSHIIKEMRRQYDGRLGYRVMEALRNYVQHRGLPIDSVQHLLGRAHGAPGYAANIVTPFLNTRRIREDGGFKSAVLNELSAIGEKVDLKPLVRDYIEGLEEVHRFLRNRIKDDADGWEATLGSAMERHRRPNEALPSLFVVQVDDADETIEEVQVFESILTRRQKLEQRIPLYGNLSKQIVTSEAKNVRQEQ